MPNKLTITFIAGALALASFSAFAFDIPDSGSKNFSPSGDTPTYLTNENVPVSARTADTTPRDWSAVEAAAPAPSVVGSIPPAHTDTGRHGRYGSAQGSPKHTLGKSRAEGHSTRFGKQIIGNGMAKSGPASATKTKTAKHGKVSARHAVAATTHPAAIAGTMALPKEA
jgi:hypothetical protein